ncbi:hypothetical protein CRG98_014546 [Punica granatum]|uniref:Uncharacterized protein n=1 Tax=Punica granatum TaxID=22663 RepID=A0A2I0K953_PUNGR|nr:hypothetical protein CRG98_014546 [Punica granatum]
MKKTPLLHSHFSWIPSGCHRKLPYQFARSSRGRTLTMLVPGLASSTTRIQEGSNLRHAEEIFHGSLERCIIANFNFLRSILKSDKKTLQAIGRSCYRAGPHDSTIAPNIRNLLDYGVSRWNVAALLHYVLNALYSSGARLREAMRVSKEMGIDPEKSTFQHALMVVLGTSKSSWESKNPLLLTQSLEKKTIPKASVLRFLLSEDLFEKNDSLGNFFKMSDKAFMRRIARYREAGNLLVPFGLFSWRHCSFLIDRLTTFRSFFVGMMKISAPTALVLVSNEYPDM